MLVNKKNDALASICLWTTIKKVRITERFFKSIDCVLCLKGIPTINLYYHRAQEFQSQTRAPKIVSVYTVIK